MFKRFLVPLDGPSVAEDFLARSYYKKKTRILS